MNISLKYKFLSAAVALLTVVGCSTLAEEGIQASQSPTVQASAPAASPSRPYTPAENNAIVERMFDGAWNEGNLAVVDELIAPDALDHSPLATETGSEGFKKIIGAFRAAMPNLVMSIEDEIYAGDRVVHRWKIQGDHTGAPLFGVPPSGKQITLTGITIVRVDNGKIVERWTQLDQLGLMQQLGMIPAPN